MSKMYFGESIRVENGTTGLPIFGKYTAIVRRVEVRVFLAEQDGSQWSWVSVNGCTGGEYATEQEARERGVAWTLRRGYIFDRDKAEQDAIDAAKKRHNDHCVRSKNYAKHYG